MIDAKAVLKLNKLLKVINLNYPTVKLDYIVSSDGSVCFKLFDEVFFFENMHRLINKLVFLVDAKFSRSSIECLKKRKIKKRKSLFFFWVLTCKGYESNKGRSLQDLKDEFYSLYKVEVKQGRKTNAERQERAQKRLNSSERC